MLEWTDAIMKEFLEPVTFVLACPTLVRHFWIFLLCLILYVLASWWLEMSRQVTLTLRTLPLHNHWSGSTTGMSDLKSVPLGHFIHSWCTDPVALDWTLTPALVITHWGPHLCLHKLPVFPSYTLQPWKWRQYVLRECGVRTHCHREALRKLKISKYS